MSNIVEKHREALTALCSKFCVARLELFGSAATGRFDDERSDLDFLVEFYPDCPMGPFDQFMDFLLELERLFGRRIDLVESSVMKNPYFIRSVNATRTLLYAA